MGPVILLDLDGTLIDSNDAHAACWVETLGEFGYSVPFEKIRPLIGMGTDQLLPRVVTLEPHSKMFKQLAKRRGELFRRYYLPELVVFPQARELIEKMRSEGFTCVAATSASQEDLQGLLEKIQIEGLLHDATTSGDAESSKPNPEILQRALKKVNAEPSKSWMIGDTPYDLLAARQAGVRSLAFTCGGWGLQDLDLAVHIYEGPWDLLAQWESCPLKEDLRGGLGVSQLGLHPG